LGKWVLRYLFSNLIDEEIRRDEDYRKMLEKTRQDRERLRLENAVTKITIPSPILSSSDSNERGGPAVTPLAKPAAGGYTLFPLTPSMGIGLATPSSANASNVPFITTPWDDGTTGKSADRTSGDYFSTESNSNAHVNSSPKNGLLLGETASEDIPPPQPPVTPPADKEKEKDEKDSSLFAKWRPFGNKKLGRSASTDMGSKSTLPTSDEKPSEQAAIEEAIDKPDLTGETLAGVIKKIRSTYQIQVRETQGESSVSLLTPSLPQETPVLKPPRNTTIIVQEDKPDSGGVADLYRGTVGCVGEDADLLESVTPAWLGEVLLLNRIPLKDTIKISFVLIPWQDELPYLPSESGRFVFPGLMISSIIPHADC
jgi:WD repeat-containing protein 48